VTSDDPQNIGAIQQAFVIASTASCATVLAVKKILSRGRVLAVNAIILSYF
jgi:hypothetical protein